MLSFQITNSGQAVQIYCDAEGMATLLKHLAGLIGAHADHRHLLSPSCGGSDLNDTNPWGEKAICEVIIDYQEAGSN